MSTLESFFTNDRPKHMYVSLAERLQEFIFESNFQQGDKLPPERTLAEKFGVSRGSVREAIRVLAEKGILESRHGDGTYIHGLDIGSLGSALASNIDSKRVMFDDITEFRRIIEPAIAELAALRHTPEQLDRLKIVLVDHQRRLLLNEDDGELDALFHLHLAECSGNQLFVETMKSINALYAEGRTADLRNAEWKKFSVSSHLRIIDALERHSPADARKELEEHIDYVAQTHLFAKTRD